MLPLVFVTTVQLLYSAATSMNPCFLLRYTSVEKLQFFSVTTDMLLLASVSNACSFKNLVLVFSLHFLTRRRLHFVRNFGNKVGNFTLNILGDTSCQSYIVVLQAWVVGMKWTSRVKMTYLKRSCSRQSTESLRSPLKVAPLAWTPSVKPSPRSTYQRSSSTGWYLVLPEIVSFLFYYVSMNPKTEKIKSRQTTHC